MSFFSPPQKMLGIEALASGYRVAIIQKKRKNWALRFSEYKNVNELYSLPSDALTTSLFPGEKVLIRSIELPIKKEKDMAEVLEFQIEPSLPYPIEQSLIRYQILKEQPQGTAITYFTLRKRHLEEHLDSLKEKSIQPEYVTCPALALAALSTFFPLQDSPSFVVHVGEEEVTCALVKEGKLLEARAFNLKENFSMEMQRIFLVFSQKNVFSSIFFLGENTFYAEEIKKHLKIDVFTPSLSPFSLSPQEIQKYGLAIGTAFVPTLEKAPFLNFCFKTFSFPYSPKHFKKTLLYFFTASICLFCALFCVQKHSLTRLKKRVEHRFSHLLSTQGKRVIHSPTLSSYEEALESIEEDISASGDFPLLPVLPQVRDLLVWLDKHPFPSVKIDTFQYAMVKYPTIKNPQEPYCVRVSLEVAAENASVARNFYEKLATPNAFVDTQKDILWNGEGKNYRMVFYLKDKTRYL